MRTYVKIKDPGLGKLNNAEFSTHSTRFLGLTRAVGATELGVEEEAITRYQVLNEKMQDYVNHTTFTEETAEMQALDRKREEIGKYVLDSLAMQRNLPIAAMAEAAATLYKRMEPYVGFHLLPNLQQTSTINGMVEDLNKEENAELVQTLGLGTFIAELAVVNAQYQVLTDQRTISREAMQEGGSKVIRTEMYELYDYITTMAFVQSVANPSEATAQYIKNLNDIIDETNTAYKQRVAQAKANEEKKKEEDKDESGTTETPENSETPETPEN